MREAGVFLEDGPAGVRDGGAGQLGGSCSGASLDMMRWSPWIVRVVDLTVQPDQMRELVGSVRPDVILNAAAYTAVDRAESSGDAMAMNAAHPDAG